MNGSSEDAGIRTLTAGELIAGVVEKHSRFLKECRQEFEELDSQLNQLEDEVKSSKASRNQMMERKEVLKEKRQQFYHQAEALLEKELLPNLGPMPADKIQEELKKLKAQVEPQEEQKFEETFMEKLREEALKAGIEESLVQQIGAKIEEARNSNQELKKIYDSEKQLEEAYASKNKELAKAKPQHKLLGNKIKSHEEALKYWETLEH